MKSFLKATAVIVFLVAIEASAHTDLYPITPGIREALSDVIVFGRVTAIQNFDPAYPRIRLITIEVDSTHLDTTASSIAVFQLRPDYDTTEYYHDEATFSVDEVVKLFLRRITADSTVDLDGVTPVDLPSGTKYMIPFSAYGKETISPPPPTPPGIDPVPENDSEPRDPGNWLNPGGLLRDGAKECCIYLNFLPTAFDKPDPTNPLSFTDAQKDQIKEAIKAAVTADFNIPDCDIKVTTDADGCDTYSKKFTARIGTNPGGRNWLGAGTDAERGVCKSGNVDIYTANFFPKKKPDGSHIGGVENDADKVEDMARAVAGTVAHEVGHQMGLVHVTDDDNRVMDKQGASWANKEDIDRSFGPHSLYLIKQCCCPGLVLCSNRFKILADGWNEEYTEYEIQHKLKAEAIQGTVEYYDSGTGTWKPIAVGQSLPKGTKIRVKNDGNSAFTLKLDHSKGRWFAAASALSDEFTNYLHMTTSGKFCIEESGDCVLAEHCGGSSIYAQTWVAETPGTDTITICIEHDTTIDATVICNDSTSVGYAAFMPLVGPDSGLTFYLLPGNCVMITIHGVGDQMGPDQGLTFTWYQDGEMMEVNWYYRYLVDGAESARYESHFGKLDFRAKHPEHDGKSVQFNFFRPPGQNGWRQTIFSYTTGGVSDVYAVGGYSGEWIIPDISALLGSDCGDTIFTAVDMNLYGASNPGGFGDLGTSVGKNLSELDVTIVDGQVEGLEGIYWATSEWTLDTTGGRSIFKPIGGVGTLLNSADCPDDLEVVAEHVGGIQDDGTVCCTGARGNVDGDAGENVNVADLTYLVNYLFGSGSPPPCWEEADLNGDGSVNVADLTYLVDYLFVGGPAPLPCP